jgi:UDP:flavonoid glycosyltransferase YjiC (YdhE family)
MYCWSPSILPKPIDWADHIAVTGYWFLPTDPWTPPEDLVNFLNEGPKPIYIGFGSVNVNDPDKLTKAIIKALIKTKQRAVLMKSWGGTESITKYPHLIYPLER